MTACCCIDVFDGNEFEAEINRRARKKYTCCECRRTIPVGAGYWVASIKYEGDWSRFRTCELCKSVRDDRFSCGFIFENMWQDMRECLESPCNCEGDCDCDSWLDPPTHPIEVAR